MIVDDDAAQRRLVTRALGQAGHDIIEAADVGTARSLLEREHIDVVVTDVIMPGERGVALGAAVAAIPGTEIVYMSGYAREVLDEHHASLDDAILLQKPFEFEQLLECVELAHVRARMSR